MQFVVMGYDGKDDRALDRRMAAREAHLEMAGQMHEKGYWLFAAALLDDDGKMTGSMIVCDFPSREEMDRLWLEKEPYVKGKVWQTIEVKRVQTAPFCTP